MCLHCEKLFDLNFSSLLGLEKGEEQTVTDDDDSSKESTAGESLLFSKDTVVAQAIDTRLLQDKIREMVDTYDRVMLLLTHASQFIPALSARIVATEARNNRIGFGTSSAGILSGALGLAGAASILTPFGAPLLMASLAVSGSSAAVTIGNEAVNYYLKPHQAADRILVMHGMIVSLLKAAKTLQHVALGADPTLQEDPTMEKGDDSMIGEAVGLGLSIIRQTDTGINLANAAATSSAAVKSAAPGATNLINSSASVLNAVPLLGAALSGIFIAMDANRLNATLDKIMAGDPSAKAEALKGIQGDLLVFPQTADLELECQAHCQVIEKNMPSKRHNE